MSLMVLPHPYTPTFPRWTGDPNVRTSVHGSKKTGRSPIKGLVANWKIN
jgi:hypothetical protein